MRDASLVLPCLVLLMAVLVLCLIPDAAEAGKKHQLIVINNGKGKVMYDEGKKKKGKKIMMSSGELLNKSRFFFLVQSKIMT